MDLGGNRKESLRSHFSKHPLLHSGCTDRLTHLQEPGLIALVLPLDSFRISGHKTWDIQPGSLAPHLPRDTLGPGVTPAVQTTLEAEDGACQLPVACQFLLGGPSGPFLSL